MSSLAPATRDRSNRPEARGRGWRRAWRALRTLIADPERTDAVFDLIDAVPDRAGDRLYRRAQADPAGRALLARRPQILEALRDLDALATLPEGSLGRVYAEFMRGESLDPDGLRGADRGRDRPPEPREDPAQQWFEERLRDVHDLVHVITGYGRDEAGEVANLAFTYGQVPNRGIGIIVLAAAVLGPWSLSLAWQRYLFRAWRRGVCAGAFALAPFEDWLALPVAEARARLAVAPPEVAHPGGIVALSPDGSVRTRRAT